jgi:CheY-like chemotaxis protein
MYPNEIEKIHILHVDDDTSFLDVSKQILLDLSPSLDVDSAFSVDEAFNKLTAKQFDIVVSDYDMPLKNG